MKVIFHCIDNQSVVFDLLEYQFSQKCYEPEQWIIVRVIVNGNRENWSANDPSLEIGDIPSIIKWFRTLAKNEPVKYEGTLSFIEPCLEFQLLNKHDSSVKRIVIKIGGELYPKWNWEEYNYAEIVFEADNQQLLQYADDLLQDYEEFLKNNH